MAQAEEASAVREEVLRLRAAITEEVGAPPFSRAFSRRVARRARRPRWLADRLVELDIIKAEERELVLSILEPDDPEAAIGILRKVAVNYGDYSPSLVAVATMLFGEDGQPEPEAMMAGEAFVGLVILGAAGLMGAALIGTAVVTVVLVAAEAYTSSESGGNGKEAEEENGEENGQEEESENGGREEG